MRLVTDCKRGLAAVAAIVGAWAIGTRLRRRRAASRLRELREPASSGRTGTVTAADFDGLPDPVRAYFENVLEEGQPYVDAVTVEQAGELRPGDATSSWKPFTATQHVTVDPPGFFWHARVRLAPLVGLEIHDLYRNGDGSAAISLFGVVPLGGADPSPELNEAELLRYLAEAVWYPTALLPSAGVQWTAIDEHTAEATLSHGGATATLAFHFDESGDVRKVHAEERARHTGDGYEPTPWTGHWHDYERRNGMRVPTAGAVVWHLPDGDLTAWRGRVTDISYEQ
jgi:hypothetical protein